MTGRVRGVSGHRADSLAAGWEFASCAPDAVQHPDELESASLEWRNTTVPCTAASALAGIGLWSFDHEIRRFDADDWWYRTRFQMGAHDDREQLWLCCDGLATVADVWLNGELLTSSRSMFVAHEHCIDGLVREENVLVMRFRSLDALLRLKRPRPRWRAPMVEHQQLRWFRTTLLGRTPGWSPPVAAVGPWRAIRIERRRLVDIDDVMIQARADGTLFVSCMPRAMNGTTIREVTVVLERDGGTFQAPLTANANDAGVSGRWIIPDVALWWPHTHGAPALYALRLRIVHDQGTSDIDLGRIGFRTVTLNSDGGDFEFFVNGTAIFARGACWTPLDPVSLGTSEVDLDRAFEQLVSAGMNMVRVSGTMIYESDAFLDRCDRYGVLLWQEFMFANMDYPDRDTVFVDDVQQEVTQQLRRMQGRPSVALLCGNSEVEQQAAMWGADRSLWSPAFFHETLAALSAHWCPDVPYWPSSAHGGAFPHDASVGTTSYYGVGAYLRPLDDARRADVRFASECLAFANVPSEQTLQLLPGGKTAQVHEPGWKARSPRDVGATWDFDDVRDHYLAQLFRVNPAELRAEDHDRYLSLARVATGEVMASVFAEWRRGHCRTRGGLIWFLRDLWPGAGWGVVDATGTPKAAWHFLRRALSPVALSMIDEGGNGISVHVVNDRIEPIHGTLDIALILGGETIVGRGSQPIAVPPRGAIEVNAGALFDSFYDLSYAYRFGPPSHNVVVAVLRDALNVPMARAFHFVTGLPCTREFDIGLRAHVQPNGHDDFLLTVHSKRFAQSVHLDIEHFDCDDNYFHMAPGEVRQIVLHGIGPGRTPASGFMPTGTVRALNASVAATISPV